MLINDRDPRGAATTGVIVSPFPGASARPPAAHAVGFARCSQRTSGSVELRKLSAAELN